VIRQVHDPAEEGVPGFHLQRPHPFAHEDRSVVENQVDEQQALVQPHLLDLEHRVPGLVSQAAQCARLVRRGLPRKLAKEAIDEVLAVRIGMSDHDPPAEEPLFPGRDGQVHSEQRAPDLLGPARDLLAEPAEPDGHAREGIVRRLPDAGR